MYITHRVLRTFLREGESGSVSKFAHSLQKAGLIHYSRGQDLALLIER
jgi:hypothetical protein